MRFDARLVPKEAAIFHSSYITLPLFLRFFFTCGQHAYTRKINLSSVRVFLKGSPRLSNSIQADEPCDQSGANGRKIRIRRGYFAAGGAALHVLDGLGAGG